MPLPIESTGFSDALVILGAAGLVIPAFARLRINPVIGFILVGIAVGPAGLGRFVPQAPWLFYATITDAHAIEPFAELGIVLLLFSIGLELSFGRLWAMRRDVFGLGAAELIGCTLLLAAGFLTLGENAGTAFGLGIALALSSTALVLPIAGTSGPVGERAFAMLLFEDLALVPIIFGLGAISPHGGDVSAMFRTLAIGAATIGGMLVVGRLILPRLFAQAARTKSPELFLAASLLVVILASVATAAAGLSPIVGALIAGILIAETDYHSEVELMTAPFKGLALGVFLITVGMSLDLAVIAARWVDLLLAVAGVILVKALVTGLLLRVGGAKRSVSLETGLLMSAPAETTLIVLGAAASAGLIARDTASFWQIVTALGLTVTPLLAEAGNRLAKMIERRSSTVETASLPADGKARVLIIGFGRVGRLVAQMLEAHKRPYLAIDADADTIKAARERGYSATFGDIARPGMIDLLQVEKASAIVLTMDDPVQEVRITKRLRSQFPDLTIIARARDPNHAAQLYRAGATDAVPETVESSLQLSEAVLVDLGLAMGPVIASIHDKRAQLRAKIMEMAEMSREPPLRGRRLGDVEGEA